MRQDGAERPSGRSRSGMGTLRLLLVVAAAVVAVPLAVLPIGLEWGLPVEGPSSETALVPVPPPGPDPVPGGSAPGAPPAGVAPPDVALPPGAMLPPDATLPPPASLLPPGAVVPGSEFPAAPGRLLPPGTPYADLAVVMASDPPAPAAGRPVTYTLTTTSKGPTATGRTTLVDTLPPGFVYRSATVPAGMRCTAIGVTVTCEGPGMRPGDSRSVAITALVGDGAAAEPVPNTAQVSSDLPDPVPGDDRAVGAARVERGADLVPGAAVTPGPVVAGTRVALGASVVNRGPSSADGVVVSTVLPPGVSFVSASVPGGECSAGGTDVTCRLAGPLAPSAVAAARVLATVDAGYVGDAMTHTVTTSAATPDPLPAGGVATARSVVVPRSDLTVTTSGPPGLAAGTEGTWVTVVTNRGPSVARDVTLGGALTGLTPTDVDASSGTCSATGTAPSCALGALAPGESTRVRTVASTPPGVSPRAPATFVARAVTATPQVRAVAGTAAPGTVTPEEGAFDAPGARGAAETPGTTTGDTTTSTPGTAAGTATAVPTDTATAAATVGEVADLAVALSQQRPGGVAGLADLGTDFALRARNLGPSDATDAVLSAVVPPGLQVAAVSPECVLAGQRVTCRFARVPAAGEAAATFTTRQTPGAFSGPRQIRATAAAAPPDPRRDNDAATATTGAPDAADLSVTATAPVDRVVAGRTVTRTLTVRNAGAAAAPGVVLTEAVGRGATATALPAGCRATAGGTACDLGTIGAGQERRVTLSALLDPDHPTGPLVRSAAARVAGDPSPSDNTTQTMTTVLARADVSTTVTRVGDGAAVAGGAPTTYRVRARNAGPSVAPGVVLDLDTPPAGVRVLRATTAAGQCSVRASRALCPVAPVAPGEAVEALVTVASAPDLPAGSTVVSAAATSMVPDPTRDDARAGLAAPVTRVADLRTRVDAEPLVAARGVVVPGAPTTYRVGVTNTGPSVAARTVFSATLPPGATALSVTSSRGRCTVTAARVDCAAGDLGAGGRAVATIVVGVPSGARGPLVVGATASSATPDVTPDPGAAGLTMRVAGGAVPAAPAPGALPVAEPAAVAPGAEDTAGATAEAIRSEDVAAAATLAGLPILDALGLMLAGAAVPTVVGGIVMARRRLRR